MLVMENINMTHVFKHPKFYRIPRDKTDQAICKPDNLEVVDSVRSDPGQTSKQQASSSKPHAPSSSNNKPQASSPKRQASSSKPQAASSRILSPS